MSDTIRRDKLGRTIPKFDRSASGKKAAETVRERYGKDWHKKLATKGGQEKTRGYFGYLKDQDPEALKSLVTRAGSTPKRPRPQTDSEGEEDQEMAVGV